jgi:DNA polymerase delta subunit 3
MLYEFHRQQNGKKPGTVHATYLISGTKRKEEPLASNGGVQKDGEDDYMQSSPFINSSMPQHEEGTGESGVLSITLVREENLEGRTPLHSSRVDAKISCRGAVTIWAYFFNPYLQPRTTSFEGTAPSPYGLLEAHETQDLQVLSDVTRQIQELCATEDPLEFAPKYGTIINKNVKRRTGKRPVPAPAAATIPAKAQPAKEAPKPSVTSIKQEAKPLQSSTAKDFFGKGKEKTKPTPAAATASNPSSKESTPNPPALKRDNSSIFKAFAKGKPKLERQGTDSSAAAEDSPMKDVSDDEEETYVPPPQPASTEIVDSDRKSRKEREAALKKMMEDDDEEEEEEVVSKPVEVKEREKSVEVKEEEPSAVVSSGRRRGRRRVMKKKTFRDEEGYLGMSSTCLYSFFYYWHKAVTKDEPVWESFSEDEPVAPLKPKVQSSTTASKAKKPAAKAGQGNIMSFFGKK